MKAGTAILIGLGVLAVGGIGFFIWRKRSEGLPVIAGPTTVGSTVNPGLLIQPSVNYPVQPPSPTRIDTVSQPWSATRPTVDASSALAMTDMQKQAADLSGAASIITSVKSIWDDLDVSSWWSDSSSSIQEENSFSSSNFSWNSYLGVGW